MEETTALLSLPEGMQIEHIQATGTSISVSVIATHPTSCCPLCTQPSSSIHSHYSRMLRDVPCGGRSVQLFLTVRKFFCRNLYCKRKVFTERLPTFVKAWARTTIRFCEALQSIGLATCGEGGTRLAARLSLPTSRKTLLRRVMDLPNQPPASILYLGIDDWSWRRGKWFGSILVDLESHRVVDLLPDRRAETAAQWMRAHPDIFVVSRDRGSEYAKAASDAAPQATQVADRFHVLKNLTEATQLLLSRCQAEIHEASKQETSGQSQRAQASITLQEWRPLEPAHVAKARLTRRAGRYERYQQVVELHEQGISPKQIAQRLGLSDRTVRDWLKQGTFPEARKRRKRQNCFDSVALYVLSRWREGMHNGTILFRELQARGFQGSDRTLYRYLKVLKQAEVLGGADHRRLQKFTASTAVWLFGFSGATG